MRIRSAAIGALALVLAACGRLTGAGDGTIEHPTGAGRLVLRVETGGGFVPIEYSLRHVPEFSLYGDGRIITPGPQIEIYPGPALPNLLVTPVTEEGIQRILGAARDAGLMGPDRSYDYPCIMDAATTTFTLYVDGAKHVVSAYALGEGQGGECPDVDTEARAKLSDFQGKLFDFPSWWPEGSVGEQRPYEPPALRVYVRPYTATPEPALEQPAKDWPLDPSLASFGEPQSDVPDTRCGMVQGDDLAKLLPEARSSNELTPWRSGGEDFLLIFRPLLPDEHGC